MTDQATNPLLDNTGLPRFATILPEHVEPAIDYLLTRNKKLVNALIKQTASPDWDNFMAPLEQWNDELERTWSPVSHLNSVRDSEALREAYQACLPKLSEYATEMGQNRALYEKVAAITQRKDYGALDAARKKVIENSLRDFRLTGIDLSGEDQQRYLQISSELSRLANEFSQNVLDATDGWHIDITDISQIKGIPEDALQLAHQTAELENTWRFTLQGPSYIAVMTYAENRALREQVYRAFATRASDQGPGAGKWDNGEIMVNILKLRQEEAGLLGFENYSDLSLETKMAKDAEQVFAFINQLSQKSKSQGRSEVAQLEAFAAEHLGLDELSPWDFAFVSDKLRQHRYDYSEQALRKYFPLPTVMQGMFAIVEKLFGIQVEAAPMPEVWHQDVAFFRIVDEKRVVRGHFYTDLFARPQKRGGAWMADFVGRRKTIEGMQLPVAFLTCNFSAPVNDQPSLLTHDDVMTLFHEFGHGLHHMLTKIEVSGVSGINGVPWDAVELPSQFLENWCWEKEALDLISGHADTGESLPLELLEKMRAAKNFQSAMQMCRQLEFSLFDFRIHANFIATDRESIQQLLDQVRDEVAVVPAPAFHRFQNGFGHIFAGGYAAGYYSYKWAEVLSADAYSLFEENGVFDEATGRSFLKNVLEKGGAKEPMELFTAFRGREPRVEALLRHSGLSLTGVAA